jgi:ribosomal protein L35
MLAAAVVLAAATRAGFSSAMAFARHVLAHRDRYTSRMVRKANFVRNAARWRR